MKFPKIRLKLNITIKENSKLDRVLKLTKRFRIYLQGKKAFLAIVVVFVAILIFLTTMSITTKDKGFSPMENRTLAAIPEFSYESIFDGSYMKEFEAYASDNFIWRDSWVKIAGMMEKICGKKDNGKVFYGKEGYLFAIDKVDTLQMERNSSYVMTFMDNVRKRNPDVRFSILVAPTASEVQKQYLPDCAPVPDEKKAINEIAYAFGDEFCDVLPALSEHSQEYLYYKTDHHWTTLGSWYAYKQWAKEYGLGDKSIDDFTIETVNTEFYGTNYSKSGIFVRPDMIERFKQKNMPKVIMSTGEDTEDLNRIRNTSDDMYNSTFLKVRDKYSYFIDGNNALTHISVNRDGGKKAETGRRILVIKDSYAHCFIPFMTQDFDEILAVDLRYYKQDVSALVKKYNITDVMVLYNIVQYSNERNLVYLIQ